MRRLVKIIVAIATLVVAYSANAQQTEKRIALVIGNGAYQAEALPNSPNDAGLIAQTLQAAGFDVLGARDLDQDTLRRTFRDFLDKASASGPDTVAFVYLNGYGVQLEGENYFVPVDAKIARDADVSVEAVRLSDYTRPLAALKLKANIVVLDAARAHPFAKSSQPLASGLSLVEPDRGMLVAFNAAPGTVAPQEKGPYGAYAQALAEMIRTGGLPLDEMFNRVRLRVNEMTKGGEVPWNSSKIDVPFVFFDRAPDAPPPVVSDEQVSSIRSKPIRDLGAQEAYVAALERDTLQGYLDFLTAYPGDPMAPRVRAIVAARREAITWRRTRVVDTPQAYWSYLRRYPRGPHAIDARRRLAYLSEAFEPPPSFDVITYDVPPPPEEEVVYFRQPVLVFDDPDYGFGPPPPPPIFFLPPPPPDFVVLAPPPPAFGLYILPVPIFVPVPAYYNRPAYVAPPPQNIIYNNIHNTVVINNTTNTVTITNPRGQTQTLTAAQALAPQTGSSPNQLSPAVIPSPIPGTQTTPSGTLSPGAAPAIGAAAGAALLAPSLPPSVAKKATVIQTQNPQANPATKGLVGTTGPGAAPFAPAQGTPTQPNGKPAAQTLPGSNGQPLPQINGKPAVPSQALPPAAGTVVPPPPAARTVTPPPPAARTVTPPPPAARTVTPPPPAARAVTPPPPAARTVTPPPPAARTVTPPPAARTVTSPPPAARTVTSPPPAARTVTPAPAKPCVLPNGQACPQKK